MDRPVITNIKTYKAIADEAHAQMNAAMEAGRRPKPDGSPGWIFTLDPDRTSFKQAMISIVFTGMWLEALMHLLIVSRYGEDVFKKYDRQTYEQKLELLDCKDQNILESAARFRRTRKELVHEKAYQDDSEIRRAQKEAENAHALLTAVHNHFLERSNRKTQQQQGP
jgi:hypothetical protein